MSASVVVKAAVGLACTCLVLQAAEVIAPQSTEVFDGAERITLDGALVAAVVFLWRALQAKDEQLSAALTEVAKALTQSNESNEELRSVIEQSVASKEHLAASVERLVGKLGAVDDPKKTARESDPLRASR